MSADRLRTWKLTPVGPMPAVSVVLLSCSDPTGVIAPIARIVDALCRHTADWELVVVTTGGGGEATSSFEALGLENLRVVAADPVESATSRMHRGRWAARGRFVLEATAAGDVDRAHLDELFPCTAELSGISNSRLAVVSTAPADGECHGGGASQRPPLAFGLGGMIDDARISQHRATWRGQFGLVIAALRKRVDAAVFEFPGWHGWHRRELAARLAPAVLRRLGVPTLVLIDQRRVADTTAPPACGVVARCADRATLHAHRVLVGDGGLAVYLTDRYEADNIFVTTSAMGTAEPGESTGWHRARQGILAFGTFGPDSALAPLVEAEALLREFGFPAGDLVLAPIDDTRMPNHLPQRPADTLGRAAEGAVVAVHWGNRPVTAEHLYALAVADTPVVLPRTPQTLELLLATGFRASTYSVGDAMSLAAAVAALMENDDLASAVREANRIAIRVTNRATQLRCIAAHLGMLRSSGELWSSCHFPLTFLRY
jgi:hypothetical protein